MSGPEEMDEFERGLSRAMRRVAAPKGLSEAVMLAVEAPQRPVAARVLAFPQRHPWIGKVAAMLLLVGLLAGGVERHHRTTERARAERDFARSLEITDQAFRHTRQQMQRAGVVLDD